MKTLLLSSSKQLALALLYGLLGIVVAVVVAGIWLLNNRPELSPWHTSMLKQEYHRNLPLTSFEQYLMLEDKLFDEMHLKIYQQTQNLIHQPLNRYVRGSYSDPAKWPQNWNRSFEWPNPQAEYALLLLHGMSDSPYSMSHLAKHFAPSAHVLGLRLPGHGTLPSSLVSLSWRDMASAVALATRHLQQALPDKPIYVMAFSTGAALALNHELEALVQHRPQAYQRMIFISPAIGLTPVAAAAKWQNELGLVLGLEKLNWNAIQTEYDPFKYNSFAVNAGDVVYQLAKRNQQLLAAIWTEQLTDLAPILTFQSVADNTVSTPDVLIKLYRALGRSDDELVLFDINRDDINMSLVVNDPMDALKPLISTVKYDLTLIQNRTLDAQVKRQVEAVHYSSKGDVTHEELGLFWPNGVYSLSHVALPFPKSDPLYGPSGGIPGFRVNIGSAATRGERGVLGVPAADILRQKWNPFYPYMVERMELFIASPEKD
ncbi:alpha/beta hydrolase [Shewanella sp. AS1]|uniref:alpha/beta hydrolase n=1 Tax=Shewanella sp. AS1 TaxID=2907626 RepID=UPI001F1C73A0|nr:alpha/beta hydrolase [Shewanella sp. AS1]MCE9679463.1 alpha/beta hydrolase [Shewanella sp. AS1]